MVGLAKSRPNNNNSNMPITFGLGWVLIDTLLDHKRCVPFLNRHLPWFVARWLATWREAYCITIYILYLEQLSFELKKWSLACYDFRLFMIYLCVHTLRWEKMILI